ncbi:MAG: hypothetical protein SCALA701_02190 [Candidatus Scalindua sp.]|nr:hypothetical protein [Planctomycetota bacterium]GJQ57418.1 MAG: hypothetical protein SCALA701_02190 [Candidatus Scalindua sp.]
MAKEMICANCGHKGKDKTVTRGSILIEIILWCAFLVPGLIYSVWRLTTKYTACPECLTANMVQVNSPRGKKLLEEFDLVPKNTTYDAYVTT